MKNGEQLLRAYAVLTSLREGLPQSHWVGERWVGQFNSALAQIERALGINLAEFKVQSRELERLIETQREDPDTGEHDITYSRELSCERTVLLQRINAVLIYFTGLQSGQQTKIGFPGRG